MSGRLLRKLLAAVGCALLWYFALFRQSAGAANVVMFLCGSVVALSLIMMLTVSSGNAAVEGHHPLEVWFDAIVDVSLAGLLAWHGWFWCAAAWTWSAIWVAVWMRPVSPP